MKTHNIAITLAALTAVSAAVSASSPVLSTQPGAMGNHARENKQDSVLSGARTPNFPGTQNTAIPNPCIDAQGRFICAAPPAPAPAPPPPAPVPAPAPPPPPPPPAPAPSPVAPPTLVFPASIDMWCSFNATWGYTTNRPMNRLGGNASCEQTGSFSHVRPPLSWRLWPEFFFADAAGTFTAADFANPAKFQITWQPACPSIINGRCQYGDFMISGTNATGWQETTVTIKHVPTGATKTFSGRANFQVCGFMGTMGSDDECMI